ncbi:hypothetical protein EON65_36650 [archaeon]|nr:MAG: hypothetical protein EON65_36650 [archaeon]
MRRADSLLAQASNKKSKFTGDEVRSATLLSFLTYDDDADISKETLLKAISANVKLPKHGKHVNFIMPWKDYQYLPYWLDGVSKFNKDIRSKAGGCRECFNESMGIFNPDGNMRGFKCTLYLNKKTNTIYVAFRGTIGMRNACTDLTALQVPISKDIMDKPIGSRVKVHSGFQDAYLTIRDELRVVLMEALAEMNKPNPGPVIIASRVVKADEEIIVARDVSTAIPIPPPPSATNPSYIGPTTSNATPPPPVNPMHTSATTQGDVIIGQIVSSPSLPSPPPPSAAPHTSTTNSVIVGQIVTTTTTNTTTTNNNNNNSISAKQVIQGSVVNAATPPASSKPPTIIFTGHSLGGALATLAALDLKPKMLQDCEVGCISVGAPAVGNLAFVMYNQSMIEHSKGTMRLVNKDDFVPKILSTSKLCPFCFCTNTPYHHTAPAQIVDRTVCSVITSAILCALVVVGGCVAAPVTCFVTCCSCCCYVGQSPVKHVSSAYISNIEKYLHNINLPHPDPLPCAFLVE